MATYLSANADPIRVTQLDDEYVAISSGSIGHMLKEMRNKYRIHKLKCNFVHLNSLLKKQFETYKYNQTLGFENQFKQGVIFAVLDWQPYVERYVVSAQESMGIASAALEKLYKFMANGEFKDSPGSLSRESRKLFDSINKGTFTKPQLGRHDNKRRYLLTSTVKSKYLLSLNLFISKLKYKINK